MGHSDMQLQCPQSHNKEKKDRSQHFSGIAGAVSMTFIASVFCMELLLQVDSPAPAKSCEVSSAAMVTCG